MKIGPSARKHDIADADIEHAVEQVVVIKRQDDDALLYFGPSRSGALLEVVKVVRDGSEVVIHAMPIRPKYEQLLLSLIHI